MIRGITPIDTAFELMGLHQAHALTRFIFVETAGGKLVFALGFIFSLVQGLRKSDLKRTLIFLMMFFSLWFLLVAPKVQIDVPVSAMERGGYHELTTAGILEKNGYSGIIAGPVLDAFCRWTDVLVSGSVAVLDRVSKGKDYLKSPFLFCKVSMLTSSIISRGIADPAAAQALARFCQDHYWPAVRRLSVIPPDLWPGHAVVAAAYTEQGRREWGSLRDALYDVVDQDRVFERMFEHFYDGHQDRDAVVRALLFREMGSSPDRYTLMAYGLCRGPEYPVAVDEIPLKIMAGLPFLQGGALFLAYASFPLFLAAVFVSRRIKPLAVLMGMILSIKLWTLAWAVVDKSSIIWFAAYQIWGGGQMWQAPAVNWLAAVSALALPLILTTGAVMVLVNERSRS